MTKLSWRTARLTYTAATLLMCGLMTVDAYAHTVRWPQNTCRVSTSSHCKKPIPATIADRR